MARCCATRKISFSVDMACSRALIEGSRPTNSGTTRHMNTKPVGELLRDIMARNMDNFRVFGPDENSSNKLDAIYEVSKKLWLWTRTIPIF